MKQKDRPIGFWLKEADRAITERVNRGLEELGLTRFHWQVINVLYENESVSRKEILDILAHFLDDIKLNQILSDFAKNEWITARKNTVVITNKGKAAYGEVRAAQQKIRMDLFTGLTKDEYETTMKVLKKIVENSTTT